MTANVTVQTTRYLVSYNGEDGVAVKINVELRGDGLWAIVQDSECMNAKGEWDFEPRPSERDEEWLAAHRFDEKTALELAQKEAGIQAREA